MAIQNRRGNRVNFDANKMLSGEFAYVLDTGELFYCVSPGVVKTCATKEDLQQILTSTPDAYTALQELIADLENETVLSGILADISNLKSTKLAIIGDSKTNTTTFAEASTLANINSAETHATLFGKIKKFFSFVGTTALNTAAQTISAATNEISATARSGWSALLTTDKLTYKSASAPIYVCNTLNTSNAAKDLRSYLSVGMKVKITQDAVVKYFFITAIDATSVTLYGGTDYVLTNATITNVCYSVVQSPYGFPIASTGLGVDFAIEQGVIGIWKYKKLISGKCEIESKFTSGFDAGMAWIGGFYHRGPYMQLPFAIYNPRLIGAHQNNSVLGVVCGADFFYGDPPRTDNSASAFRFYILNATNDVLYSSNSGEWSIKIEGEWK